MMPIVPTVMLTPEASNIAANKQQRFKVNFWNLVIVLIMRYSPLYTYMREVTMLRLLTEFRNDFFSFYVV